MFKSLYLVTAESVEKHWTT